MLPVKAHQLYQTIILLKAHLLDLLPQYASNSNLLPSQIHSPAGPSPLPGPLYSHLTSHLDRPVCSPSPIQKNIDLIDQFIDSPVLSNQLKTLASSLHQNKDQLFYTDSSLQRNPDRIDSMGIGWISANQEELTFSASAIL